MAVAPYGEAEDAAGVLIHQQAGIADTIVQAGLLLCHGAGSHLGLIAGDAHIHGNDERAPGLAAVGGALYAHIDIALEVTIAIVTDVIGANQRAGIGSDQGRDAESGDGQGRSADNLSVAAGIDDDTREVGIILVLGNRVRDATDDDFLYIDADYITNGVCIHLYVNVNAAVEVRITERIDGNHAVGVRSHITAVHPTRRPIKGKAVHLGQIHAANLDNCLLKGTGYRELHPGDGIVATIITLLDNIVVRSHLYRVIGITAGEDDFDGTDLVIPADFVIVTDPRFVTVAYTQLHYCRQAVLLRTQNPAIIVAVILRPDIRFEGRLSRISHFLIQIILSGNDIVRIRYIKHEPFVGIRARIRLGYTELIGIVHILLEFGLGIVRKSSTFPNQLIFEPAGADGSPGIIGIYRQRSSQNHHVPIRIAITGLHMITRLARSNIVINLMVNAKQLDIQRNSICIIGNHTAVANGSIPTALTF